MEMKIHYKTLPIGMTSDDLKEGLARILDEDGWLTGSFHTAEGGWVELELEEEERNPKHAIVAVKNYLQTVPMPRETAMELAGLVVGVYE